MSKFFFLLIIISFQARAFDPALQSAFKSLLANNNVGLLKEQAFCYSKNKIISGYNVNKAQRIASVTKLLTTLLVSETMDLNQTFKTKIYIGKDSLHIEGGSDPYFEEEKFLLLLKALNDLGYQSFKKVTFTKNFLFYDLALGDYERISPEKTQKRIAFLLNSKNASSIRSYWSSAIKFAEEEGVLLEGAAPSVTTPVVAISDINPLLWEHPVMYEHQSLPLHTILKSMNVQSKNLVAENLYQAASKIKTLGALLRERGVESSSYRIYNGSGLPIISTKSRLDNVATCSTVLKVISFLSESVKKHGIALTDIIAINGGKDLGSFRERFKDYPETHNSVVSKTGTVKHTSSLAGFLLAGEEIPFAILNHTRSPSSSRKFQDAFVAKMLYFLGPAIPVHYTKIPIFPWNNSDFLQRWP